MELLILGFPSLTVDKVGHQVAEVQAMFMLATRIGLVPPLTLIFFFLKRKCWVNNIKLQNLWEKKMVK